MLRWLSPENGLNKTVKYSSEKIQNKICSLKLETGYWTWRLKIKMKLIEIIGLTIFIAGLHLAGADSDNMTWFLWSKPIGACLMGMPVLLGNIIR